MAEKGQPAGAPPARTGGAPRGSYRRLLGHTRPYTGRLALGVFFGMLFGGSTFGLLAALQGGMVRVFGGSETAINDFIGSRLAGLVDPGRTSFALTLAVLLLLPLFTVLRGIGFFLSKYCVEWVGQRVVLDLRDAAFDHIQRLPQLHAAQGRTGELISRTTNDTQMVAYGVSTVIGDLARQPFVLAGAMGMLATLDYRLAAVALVLFPVCILPVTLFGRRVRRATREGQARLGDLAALQQETITGARIVVAFGREEDEARRFRVHSRSVFNRQMRVTKAQAAITPTIELISVLSCCALLLYARHARLSWDQLILFLGTLVVMYDPVKRLSRVHLGIQQTAAAADRIFEILDLPVSVRERPGARPFAGPLERIVFDGVSFRYDRDWVLRDVRLTVPAGQCLALVGGSGAGKTTLVSLLPRFFDPDEGRVLFNDGDIRDLTLASLRGLIGLVTQDTVLFNRSVAENIAYGAPGATPEAIEAAARRAHAHEFIVQMEQGYETLIGERGARLSGGQRQRLAIARALLRNPPVLVLDEATSALDSESERLVQAALEELMAGRTVFAIAHRLSTIRHADRIVVLEQGRIVETGTHAELIARGGAYKYFHDLQHDPAAAATPR